MKKNFVYGDLWESKERKPEGVGRCKKVPAYKVTSNKVFLDFLHDLDYEVILDPNHESYAYTDMKNRQIVLNENYPDDVLEAFLKHELGHLMLFNVNQFTSIRDNTMRSVIAQELYKVDHVTTHGVPTLMFVENIIQDIIIETVSGGDCVCSTMLRSKGHNAGVKHLTELEDVRTIARETIENVLPSLSRSDIPSFDPKVLGELLESMLKDLMEDSLEIKTEIEATLKRDYQSEYRKSRQKKQKKLEIQRQTIERVEELKGELTPALERTRDIIERKLESLEEASRSDELRGEKAREKKLKNLSKKLESNEKLKEKFENLLSELKECGSSGVSHDDSQSDGGKGDGKVAHSFDCGLPHPVTIDREDNKNERFLGRIDSTVKVSKIFLNEDDDDIQSSGRKKTTLNEDTYLKSSKREWDSTDMMKGRRRRRMSGVNVLIGLDVSGSMTNEWGAMFEQMIAFVEELREKIEILNVYCFTYNSKLKEWSTELEDLSITAGGGNAFGFVYQNIMQNIPLHQRNELILVTDCGDNLGFTLSEVCEVSKQGQPVLNHVSVIDVQERVFYALNDFDQKDWSLHMKSDPELFRQIKSNIEKLIER